MRCSPKTLANVTSQSNMFFEGAVALKSTVKLKKPSRVLLEGVRVRAC